MESMNVNNDNADESANDNPFSTITDDTDWNILLACDGNNLVDNLELCIVLAQKPEITASETQLDAYFHWIQSFLKSKGVQHLIKLFEDCDFQNVSLMTVLLPLLNSFLIDAISTDAVHEILNITPNNKVFVEQLNQPIYKQCDTNHIESKSEENDDIDVDTDVHTKIFMDFMKNTIKKTKQQHASSIMDSVDCKKLLLKLLKVSTDTSSLIVDSTQFSQLWIALLFYKPNLLLHCMDFLQLQNDSFSILNSNEFMISIFRLCATVQTPTFQSNHELQHKLPSDKVIAFCLKDILLKTFPKCNVDDSDNLKTYFDVLMPVLDVYISKYNHSVIEFPQLYEYIIRELKQYKSKEIFDINMGCDGVLCGLMDTLSVLLYHYKPYIQHCIESGFMNELWETFLFSDGQSKYDKDNHLPKCKTDESKTCAFRLIIQCIRETPETHCMMIRKIQEFQDKTVENKKHSTDYQPLDSMRSPLGYSGLRNVGQTAWINCLLQQLYMMPSFRNSIISAGIQLKDKSSNSQYKESLLYPLMRMFSFLSLSIKDCMNTMDFCRNFKDDTGRPMDIRIQRDVSEFFIDLAEKVGTELQDTSYSNLWRDSFGSEMCIQMICKGGCDNIREKKEECMMITLPIKGNTNLKQSLQSYVSTEHLQDVQCDICKRKCDTLRRNVFSSLPNTILFRLERFTLNFETFQCEKIYDRFEFPQEIDLKDYSKEGVITTDDVKVDDGYYTYELYGVIVHSGNEEDEDCYSYIKDRETHQWMEFNDDLVRPFDIHCMPQETFGGVDPITTNPKLNTAYILIYQRKQFEAQTTPTQLIVSKAPGLYNEILEDNATLIHDIQLYNIAYFEFIYKVLCITTTCTEMDEKKHDDDCNMVKISTLLCIKYLSKTSDKATLFRTFIHYFKYIYTGNIDICTWFLKYLSKTESCLESFILSTRDGFVRTGVSDLIMHSLRQMKDVDTNTTCIFMDRMIALIDIAPKHWFRFGEYFNIFYAFSCIGHKERNCLIDKGLINILGDFYLGNRSPYAVTDKVYTVMGSRMYPPKFDTVIQIICQLLCASHTPQTQKRFHMYKNNNDNMDTDEKQQLLQLPLTALVYKDAIHNTDCLHTLSKKDETLPLCKSFYDRLLGDAHHKNDVLNELKRVIVHWSFEDKSYSQEAIRIINEGVDKSGADQVKTYLAIMREFIMIEDTLQDYRLVHLHAPSDPDHGVLYFINCYQLQHQPFTYACMKGIADMMTEYKPYLMFMITQRDRWAFWDEWLEKYCARQEITFHAGEWNSKEPQEKMDWYKHDYLIFLQKHYELLVYGFIKDIAIQINFEKHIPLDIIPEFVKFFW